MRNKSYQLAMPGNGLDLGLLAQRRQVSYRMRDKEDLIDDTNTGFVNLAVS